MAVCWAAAPPPPCRRNGGARHHPDRSSGVNLYPFEATVARGGSYTDHVETIDIGGPAMIRAASKTHERIAVVVDVEDYDALLAELDANAGSTTALFRRKLAATAFARTAAYDAAIAGWLNREVEDTAPRRFVLAGAAPREMRYGENPHQARPMRRRSGAPA